MIEMESTDYKAKLVQIETSYLEAKKQLNVQYAKDLRSFAIGDTVTDGNKIIKIVSFGTYLPREGLPIPIYKGIALTKKLKPTKNNGSLSIYGDMSVKLIKTKQI